MKFRAGDLVEVRTKEQILATLDKHGRLKELPFMPQMFQYCGQRFKVYKRAHKTCDTVNPIRGRWVSDAVHLDLRCDGAAYGGCQAACLVFWKTAWLKPVDEMGKATGQSSRSERVHNNIHSVGTTEADVIAGTYADNQNAMDGPRYICQATELPVFTTQLRWWDIRQYMEDIISGNVTFGKFLRGVVYASYNNLINVGWNESEVIDTLDFLLNIKINMLDDEEKADSFFIH